VLLTAGIALIASATVEYLVDVIDRHYRPAVLEAASEPETGEAASAGRPPGFERGRTHYVIALLRWFVRVLGYLGAVVLILRVWNVPVRPEWLNWGAVGLGALAILIALVIDRIVFTALFTLALSGRLPDSTVNIIRRWVRGALTVLVGLTLIAVAGFEIDSIWTFLTAFLAMVAIGFVAVWSILSNILATLVILIWRPFNIGERIEVLPEGVEGQVVDINFIYTILKSGDGKKISIPNNLFAQKFIRRQSVRTAPEVTLAEQLVSEKALDE
jgi:small-conductance mechanosensitive channel